MNDLISLGIIVLVSLVLGYMSYVSSVLYDAERNEKRQYKNAPWQWKFFEIWNFFINFFFAGLILYYFIAVRLTPILNGEIVSVTDFALLFILAMCLFRWFPYLIRNITEGINVIIKRILLK